MDICFHCQLCWKIRGHSSLDLPVLSNLLMMEKLLLFLSVLKRHDLTWMIPRSLSDSSCVPYYIVITNPRACLFVQDMLLVSSLKGYHLQMVVVRHSCETFILQYEGA